MFYLFDEKPSPFQLQRPLVPFKTARAAAVLALSLIWIAAQVPEACANPASKQTASPRKAPDDQLHLQLTYGDKLKINFFERLDQEAGDDSSKSSNLIERVELSGNYTVQSDGALYLPILGPQRIAGQDLLEVEKMLEQSFQEQFGKLGRVSVAVAERSPVFIVGRVAKPGTFDHVPGMTVLHVLAQAGGFEQGLRAEMYDVIREQQKLDDAIARQRRILARLETLLAERANVPPVPSAKLSQIAGDSQAIELIKEQLRLRKLASEARDLRIKSAEATIDAATRELAIQREKKGMMEKNSANKEQRVVMLQKLSDKGAGGSYQTLQAKSEFSDFQERLSEVQVIISQIEDRRAQALNEKSRILTEAQLELERDIATVEEQQIEASQQVATSTQLLLLARHAAHELSPNPRDLQFLVIRRSASGSQAIQADETTPLLPGDLVKVQPIGENLAGDMTFGTN